MRPELARFSTYKHPFLVAMSVCGRIECPCAEACFSFREAPLDAEPRGDELSFELRVEPLSWQEVEPPARSAAVAELVREFLEDYPEREKEPLRKNAERKRAVAERIQKHRFDREEVVTGTLASFREIAFGPEASYSSAFVSAIKMDDVEYLIDDLYCPNPDCECREVYLDFLVYARLNLERKIKRGFTGCLSFDGRREVKEVDQSGRGQAERVFAAWAAANESLVADLEWRYRKVKEIARRSLPKHSLAPSLLKRSLDRPADEPLRVGRNAPCPCGSGKKFKKCCGQSLLLGEN